MDVDNQIEINTQDEAFTAKKYFNILAGWPARINPNVLVEQPKGENVCISKKTRKCEVMSFNQEWTFDEVLEQVSKMKPADYNDLFVFIISPKLPEINQNEEPTAKRIKIDDKNNLETVFGEFCKTRPIIIQLTSESENETKIFYNKENSTDLHQIDETVDDTDGFASFIRNLESQYCEGTKEEKEESIFNMLEKPDPLTLRFLTIFDFDSKFSVRVILHCAEKFSKDHFLAALGIPFGDIRYVDRRDVWNLLGSTFSNQKYCSILEAIIVSENHEVFKYFIEEMYFPYHHLPFEHQIEIVNNLAMDEKIGMLCDLLERCDFPFPTGEAHDLIMTSLHDERIKNIINERNNFHTAIMNENYEEIQQFLEKNRIFRLKNVFNTDNKSAMHTALSVQKINIYFDLKRECFSEEDCNDLREQLIEQNFQKSSLVDYTRRVYDFGLNSIIFGDESNESMLELQREKIRSWLVAINKTELGGPLIRAASQDKNLKIIFDFERNDVKFFADGVHCNLKLLKFPRNLLRSKRKSVPVKSNKNNSWH